MDQLSLTEKQQQFDEFFRIKHQLKINLMPLASDYQLPEVEDLVDVMPYAFRIASEMSDLELKALRPLRHLGDHAKELVDYLNHQSRKIDLMMSYVLQQQDQAEHRYDTFEFGGGGVTIKAESALEVGTAHELKLFIPDEAAAIYCFGEVIACQAEDDEYHVSLIFTRIREEDQELLVRASLHLQTRQLKKRQQKQSTN